MPAKSERDSEHGFATQRGMLYEWLDGWMDIWAG